MNADRQAKKLGNMLADNLGAVDALRRELRQTSAQHASTLEKLDALHEATLDMLQKLQHEHPENEPAPEPKPAAQDNVTRIDDWQPGQPEQQITFPTEDEEAALMAEYKAMYQERAGA